MEHDGVKFFPLNLIEAVVETVVEEVVEEVIEPETIVLDNVDAV